MKATQIISVFVLAVFAFLIQGCSKYDEITFLEKYDGTVWKLENYDGVINFSDILEISSDNSDLMPFEIWYDRNGVCYINHRLSTYDNFKIKINAKNTFEYEYASTTVWGFSQAIRQTIISNGNTLTEVRRVKRKDGWKQVGIANYKKYTEDINDLPVCGE